MALSRFLCVFLFILKHVCCQGMDAVLNEMEMITNSPLPPDPNTNPENINENNGMESKIKKFQDIALSIKTNYPAHTTVIKDVDKLYDDMIYMLDEIKERLQTPDDAYEFLKAKGLDRIAVHLNIDYDELKTRILILIKTLFALAPTTTSAVIPVKLVDKVLVIFENDNLALKAHCLDVLNYWLPENPRVQARVMKVKGLQPFYEQLTNLDTNVIKMMLDLFNKILAEHVKVRNDVQRTIVDADKLKFYQRTALIEHVSTPAVCKGLLNVFLKTWSYNSKDNNVILSVFDTLKNIKGYCVKVYRGKAKALKLFTALQEYIEQPENRDNIVQNGQNISDVAFVIEEYV